MKPDAASPKPVRSTPALPRPATGSVRHDELLLWAFIGRKLNEIDDKYPGTRSHTDEIRAMIYGVTCDW